MLEREILGFRENHLTYKKRQMRLRARLGRHYEEVYRTLEILLCSDGTNCQELSLSVDGGLEKHGTSDKCV